MTFFDTQSLSLSHDFNNIKFLYSGKMIFLGLEILLLPICVISPSPFATIIYEQ